MRLWHYKLIPLLPRQQLLGQHRECCAMRGKGWGKKHSTVDYVYTYTYSKLFYFHFDVMCEMKARGYTVENKWFNAFYRGQILLYDYSEFTKLDDNSSYPEHNEAYYQECLDNLKAKGVIINAV